MDARDRIAAAMVRRVPSTYATQLTPGEEGMFQAWVAQNRVPFVDEPRSDYDMRGFYRGLLSGDPNAMTAIDPNDSRLHYPDYWKTPYHETFSRQSQWATPNAPDWNDQDQLMSRGGQVLFDDRTKSPYGGYQARAGDIEPVIEVRGR